MTYCKDLLLSALYCKSADLVPISQQYFKRQFVFVFRFDYH